MGEVIFFLCFAGVVVMLVGHGMWVVLAALLRLGKPKDQQQQFDPTLSDDRSATARYARHLRVKNLIDQDMHDHIMRIIADDVHQRETHHSLSSDRQWETPPPRTQTLAQPVTQPAQDIPRVNIKPAPSPVGTNNDKPQTILKQLAMQVGQPRPIEQPVQPVTVDTPVDDVQHVKPNTFVDVDQLITKNVIIEDAKPIDIVEEKPSFDDIRPIQPPVSPASIKPTQQPTAKRRIGEVLATFMAQKNIRWGDLIGGLLIVCCSTALVISLWSQIQAIPILKFMIFTGVTAGLFGSGLFVQYRWNVPTTGRAVLSIATLLVPLNFLAFAAFTLNTSTVSIWTVIIEAATVILFIWLTFLAGRVIMPAGPKLMAGGFVTIAATCLVMQFFPLHGPRTLLLAVSLPVGLYMIVMTLTARKLLLATGIDDSDSSTDTSTITITKSLFLMLFFHTFAIAAPLGLAIRLTGEYRDALQCVSPLITLLATPALVISFITWLKRGTQLPAFMRTLAATITLVSIAIVCLALGLAWPVPVYLLPTLLINAAATGVLSRLTKRTDIQQNWIGHVAFVWLTLAWVLLVNLLTGQFAWDVTDQQQLISNLLSIMTAKALLLPILVCAGMSEWAYRRDEHRHCIRYWITAGGIALISVGLLAMRGFGVEGDSQHITWVLLVYAALSLFAAWRVKHPLPSWCAALLMQMSVMQLLIFVWPTTTHTWPTALMSGATLFAVGVLLSSLPRRSPRLELVHRLYTRVWSACAITLSLVATLWMSTHMSMELLQDYTLRLFWMTALWFILAVCMQKLELFIWGQLALLFATCVAVHHHLYDALDPKYQVMIWAIPRYWQTQLLVLGGMSLFWLLVRLVLGKCAAPFTVQTDEDTTTPTPPTRFTGLLLRLDKLINFDAFTIDMLFAAVALFGCIDLCGWAIGINLLLEHGALTIAASADTFVVHASHMAAGVGSWLVLALVTLIVVINSFKQKSRLITATLAICWLCATALFAARFDATHHVVNVWRWLLAMTYAAYTLTIIIWQKRQTPSITSPSDTFLQQVVTGLFALPAMLLTGTFCLAMSQNFTIMPAYYTSAAETATLSGIALHVMLHGPMVLIIGSIMALGFYRNKVMYASVSAVLTTLSVVVIEACIFSSWSYPLTPVLVYVLLEIHAIIAAVIALLWDQLRRREAYKDHVSRYPVWPVMLSRVTVCMGLIAAAGYLLVDPGDAPRVMGHAGGLVNILAFVLVEIAILRISEKRSRLAYPVSLWVLMGVILLSLAFAPFDTMKWICFHIMSAGWVIAGWLLLATMGRLTHKLNESDMAQTYDLLAMGDEHQQRMIEHDLSCKECSYNLRGLESHGNCPECGGSIIQTIQFAASKLSPQWFASLLKARTHTRQTIISCVMLGMLFALRSALNDPLAPWWSMGILLGVATLSLALGAWAPRRAYAYLGAAATCLGTTIVFYGFDWPIDNLSDLAITINLMHVNLTALVLVGFVWLWIERRYLAHRLSPAQTGVLPILHHFAVFVTTVLLAGLACVALMNKASAFFDPIDWSLDGIAITGWIALAANALLVIACLRESFGKHVPALLHIIGMTALIQAIAQSPIGSEHLAITLALGCASYACLTGLVFRRAMQSQRFQTITGQNTFIPYTNIAMTILAMGLALGVSVCNENPVIQALACVVPLIGATAMWTLQFDTQWQVLRSWIMAQLCIVPLLASWIGIMPEDSFAWQSRLIGYIEAFTVTWLTLSIINSRLFHGRDESESTVTPLSWQVIIRKTVSTIMVLAGLAILSVVIGEISALMSKQTLPLSQPLVIGLIVSFAIMIVHCLAAAVKGKLDVFAMPANSRVVYVYAAQVLGGILALHIRVGMPWLFHGFVTQYWPLMVLGIAVAGFALGEMCCRRNLAVIGMPFVRTGMWLPLAACAELFIHVSRIHSSLVLLAVGSIYTVYSVMKRSFLMGILATITVNGSLWYLLYHTPGLGITEHPQLWIIPLAIAVLAAGYLNRHQLTAEQSRMIHYGCLLAIYLSSTMDVFLIGVAQAPWLPLVLAGLSIIGIFIGLARHIRSYLFLGTGFLCLSLLTMIWHAASNLGWTWIWYVAGIVLGIAIITVFALFEKKKNEMNKVIEEVKDWAS